MTEITAAFQTFGPTGAMLMALILGVRFLWPDVRDMLRAQTAASKALADLALRTDQRLASIERTTAATNEAVAILVDRNRRVDHDRRPLKRPSTEGVR